MSNIEELKFDDKNFNKHTEYGMSLLEKSLRDFGAGRSVLVDKDNNIIAGNGIVEAAVSAGITKTRVIETTGDELVVVKRNDVELDSRQGREMAIADNATAAADLEWDEDVIKSEREKWGFDEDDWGVSFAVATGLVDELKDQEFKEREDYFVRKKYVVITYNDEEADRLAAKLGLEDLKSDQYTARQLI